MKHFNKALSFLLAALILFSMSGTALVASAVPAGRWSSTWASSIVDGSISVSAFSMQDIIPSKSTVRIELTCTTGGKMLRFKFSNEFGVAGIIISGASVAKTLNEGSADIVDGTQANILFDGEKSVTIPGGGTVWSDPISYVTNPLERLSVSLYFDTMTYITSTGLSNGRSFLNTSLRLVGNDRSQINVPNLSNTSEINIGSGSITYHTIPFLSEISSYSSEENPATAVFIGDSTLVNNTYLHFARKLVTAGHTNISIINEAIIGNKLLSDGTGVIGNLCGKAVIDRFERDVLNIPNVKYCFVKVGLNDILHQQSKSLGPTTPKYSTDDIISGYRTLINLCHKYGIKIYFFTKSPWKGYERSFLGQAGDLSWTYAMQKQCNELDDWIRTNSEADGFIDCWDLANPADEYAMCPSFTIDGVHLTDLAAVALADLIPLEYVGIDGTNVKSCAQIEGVYPYVEKEKIIREMNKKQEETTVSEHTTLPDHLSEEDTTIDSSLPTSPEPYTIVPPVSSDDPLLPTSVVPDYNTPTTPSNSQNQNVDVDYNVIDDISSIGGDSHIVFILIMFTAIIVSGAIVILTIGRKKEEV